MKRISVLAFGLLAAGALALSGCEKEADIPVPPEDTAAAIEDKTEADAEALEQLEVDEAVEDPAELEPNEGNASTDLTDVAGCLIGKWTADNESFVAQLQEFGDEVASASGEVTVTFDKSGEMTTTYSDWVVTMVSEDLEITISRSGTDLSEYSVDGDVINIRDVDMSSTMRMEVGEMTMEGSVAKIVKLEHAWRRLDGRNDDGFQVAPFPG